METLPPYLKFEYLHRDEGNYKIFGFIIFHNPNKISPEEAEELLKGQLIDQQYFYPKEAKFQLFEEHSYGNYFSDWYEYWQISTTNENPTENRSIQDFIQELEKVKL